EPVVEPLLDPPPPGQRFERRAPEVDLLDAGTRARPRVAAVPGRHAAVVARGVEVELEGVTRGPARALGEDRRPVPRGPHRHPVLPHAVTVDDRPAPEGAE